MDIPSVKTDQQLYNNNNDNEVLYRPGFSSYDHMCDVPHVPPPPLVACCLASPNSHWGLMHA